MAISETVEFYLKKVIRISPANRNRMTVGKIMNSVLTSLAMFKNRPHYFLSSSL